MTRNAHLVPAVLASLFAALISLGAYIAFPLPGTPVPIVLQNFFIMLSALLLGPVWAPVSVAIYLCLGALGLPVFSGGTGGLARFLGPTGGYLLGYLPGVIVMALIARLGSRKPWKNAAALIMGMGIVYLIGLLRLKTVIRADWPKALSAGLLPFIPGDLIKIAVAALVAGRLSPIVETALPGSRPAALARASAGSEADASARARSEPGSER